MPKLNKEKVLLWCVVMLSCYRCNEQWNLLCWVVSMVESNQMFVPYFTNQTFSHDIQFEKF